MNYHDALAKLGIGTAHPGGFQTTKAWTEMIHWDQISNVLEVGCGTGRTACTLAQQYDHVQIVGVDIRELMIAKANQRVRSRQLSDRVVFVTADAHQMPFDDNSFDLLYMESVAIFMDVERFYKEVCRVVKPGGSVVAIEMMNVMGIPDQLLTHIQNFYGARQVPSFKQWKQFMQHAGFHNVHALQTMQLGSQPTDDFDPEQTITVQANEWQSIYDVQETNAYLLQMCAPFLGFVVLSGEKSEQ